MILNGFIVHSSNHYDVLRLTPLISRPCSRPSDILPFRIAIVSVRSRSTGSLSSMLEGALSSKVQPGISLGWTFVVREFLRAESIFDRCRLNLIFSFLYTIVRVQRLNISRTLLLGPRAHCRNLGKIGAIGVFFGDFADFHHQSVVQRNGNKSLG